MFRLRLLLVLILGVCVLSVAHAQPRTSAGHKVIVVVANRLVLADFQDPTLHSLNRICSNSSAGLISPNCQGWKNEWSVMLTAGAGTGCRGAQFIRDCYDADEVVPSEARRAGDIYTSRTDHKAGDGSAVFLNLGPVNKANAELISPIKIGALGDALHAAGKKTCVVGNADINPKRSDRAAAVLAMDSTGLIDVGQLAQPQVQPECGICADTNVLINAAKQGIEKADFTVINFGDSTRLDEMKAVISDSAYASHKTEVMRSLDRLVGALVKSLDPGDRLVLVSFAPSFVEGWNQLSPMFIYPQLDHGSSLSSPTTRTHGLIAASDFAPTVLSLMGLPPSDDMLGRAATATSGTLEKLDRRVMTYRLLLRPVLWVFGVVGIASFTAASLLVAFKLRAPRWVPGVLRVMLLFGAGGGLALLLGVLAPPTPVGHATGVFGSLAVLILASLVFGRLSQRVITAHARPVLFIFVLTVITILMDSVSNGALARFTLPSACQISGFRYYGIGNEYAGMLISMGAVIALFSYKRKWVAPVMGLVIIIAMGMGRLGANYGATIAAILTFGLVTMAIWRGGFKARHVAGVTILSMVLVALFALLDAKVFGIAGSHAGRATALAQQIGPGYVLDLIGRKVLLNLGIAGMKHVKGIFFGFTPFLALWFCYIQGKVKQLLKGTPIFAGLKGILIGAVGALLFNDSGIVFATLMVAMTVLVLLYSLLEGSERAQRTEPVEQEGTVVV